MRALTGSETSKSTDFRTKRTRSNQVPFSTYKVPYINENRKETIRQQFS